MPTTASKKAAESRGKQLLSFSSSRCSPIFVCQDAPQRPPFHLFPPISFYLAPSIQLTITLLRSDMSLAQQQILRGQGWEPALTAANSSPQTEAQGVGTSPTTLHIGRITLGKESRPQQDLVGPAGDEMYMSAYGAAPLFVCSLASWMPDGRTGCGENK